MLIKGLVYEDVANYKKTSLFLIFPKCSFKCDKENNCKLCQNSHLANVQSFNIDLEKLVSGYLANPITSAIVCGGLEPFDTFDSLLEVVNAFREKTLDDIIIYTGYREDEIETQINQLKEYKNIIVKFGRFKPNQESHYDEVLGINLANDEQHAKKIS